MRVSISLAWLKKKAHALFMAIQSLYLEVYNARREREAAAKGTVEFQRANERVAAAFAAVARAHGRV